MESELNESIVKTVWANTTRNDNPYSIQNFNASSYRRQHHHEISPPPKVTSPHSNADLYFMQNLQMMEPQTLSPPMTPTDGQPPAREAALDQIQSLILETKFVDEQSYYTKLSAEGQKEALHDIFGDDEGGGNGNGPSKEGDDGDREEKGNDIGNGQSKEKEDRDREGKDKGNGNGNEDEDDQKEIQRGPRFKHYGHDRTQQPAPSKSPPQRSTQKQ